MAAKSRRQAQPRPAPISPAARAAETEVAAETATAVPLPPPDKALALIHRLQELRGAHVLTLVARPDVVMRGDLTEHVYEQLRLIGRVPRLDLFLHSSGGQTEVPWRLITLIRDFADQFSVLIPGIALSAATHLAMGADEIVMGPLSELSPVDPARSHPLLPSRKEGEPPLTISVQDLRHCVEFIKKEMGVSAPDSLATVLCALFDKVHPLAIGAIQQSYALARLISSNALGTHMDPVKEKEQIDDIVNAFSDRFFSHQYFIGWKEAKQTGLNVTYAGEGLWEIMWALYKHYQAYFGAARPLGQTQIGQPLVWIDSHQQRRILEEIYSTAEGGRAEGLQAKRPTSRWLVLPWQTDEQASAGE